MINYIIHINDQNNITEFHQGRIVWYNKNLGEFKFISYGYTLNFCKTDYWTILNINDIKSSFILHNNIINQ